jgi:hypothetical protein
MPPTWNDGMLEFWNNEQKIDIVPIVPALHHSSIPILRPLWSDPPFVFFAPFCRHIQFGHRGPALLNAVFSSPPPEDLTG